MLSDPKHLCGLAKIFIRIGEIALRSSDDYNREVGDASDWLLRPECKEVNDPNNLPNGPMGEMIIEIFRTRKFVKWGSVFPLWEELATQNVYKQVGMADLLITTTMLTPLVRGIWKEGGDDLANKNGSDIEAETLTQIVLYWGENCVLTLDARPAGLIRSLTHIASTLGIYWIKSKRRKFPLGLGGALDPTVRVLCHNFNHIHSSDLLNKIRTTPAPLPDIAGELTLLRCSFRTPDGPRHATLGHALEVLVGIFRHGRFSITTTIVDNYDVM